MSTISRRKSVVASLLIFTLLLLLCNVEAFQASLDARAPFNGRKRLHVLYAERKKKKNKYAKFSKVQEKDPEQLMMEEAEEKNQKLQNKQGKKAVSSSVKVDMDESRQRNEILFPDNRKIDPSDPTTFGYVELGTILGAHGVKGEVKIRSVTDFAERLCNPGLRHIRQPSRKSPRRISLVGGRYAMGDEYIIQFEGIEDRDEAQKLQGHVLYARQEERPVALEQGEYIVGELVGLEAFLKEGYKNENGEDQSGQFVGTVNGVVLASEMCSTPGLGQDLIELSLPRGPGGTSSWKDELVLLPFVPQIVTKVDIEEKALFINPAFGLLNLTYVREEKVRIKGFLPAAEG